MTKLKNITAAVAMLVIFSNVINAQTAKPASYQVQYSKPFTVTYIGSDENYLLFEVSVQAPNSGDVPFEIEDKNEGSLYSSYFANDIKSKTIKIEKRDDQELNFKVVLNKQTYSKSFSINTSQVEKVTVSEGDISKL